MAKPTQSPSPKYDEDTYTMPEAPQTFANHVRFDPLFHYSLLPAIFITFVISVVHLFRQPNTEAALLAIGLLLLLVSTVKSRVSAIKVQDRVIRLEERLRFAGLADPALMSRIPELNEGQLIALRFASDAEAPSLARRAMEEHLVPKAIKSAIRNWRPDYFRV